MSQGDVEVVRTLYEAFENKDVDGVIILLGEEMVAHVAPGVPWSGSYYGRDGFRRFLEIIDEYVDLSIETDSLIDTGPVVAQVGRTTGYARSSGTRFSFDEIHFWGVRDGKIVAFRNYSDIDEQRRVLASDLGCSRR
jgi:ketosteroid isomerase-like protein